MTFIHEPEGFGVEESQLVLQTIRKGELRGEVKRARRDVLEVLQARLVNPVPEAVRLAIEGTNDPETLSRWLRAASTVGTIQEFGAAIATPS
jgi:hypothetical protein